MANSPNTDNDNGTGILLREDKTSSSGQISVYNVLGDRHGALLMQLEH